MGLARGGFERGRSFRHNEVVMAKGTSVIAMALALGAILLIKLDGVEDSVTRIEARAEMVQATLGEMRRDLEALPRIKLDSH